VAGDAVLSGRFRATTPACTLLNLATRYDHCDDDRDLWL
jgi:hypothetical protein